MNSKNSETTFVYSPNEPFDSSKAQEEIIEIFGNVGGKALETKIEDLGLVDELKLFCSDSNRRDKLLQSLSDDGFSNSRGYAYEIETKNLFNEATHNNRFRLSNIDEDKMNGRDIVDNNNPEEVIQIKNHSQLNEYIKDIHEKIINEDGGTVLKYPHGIYIPKDHADAILQEHPELSNQIYGDYHGIPLPNQEYFLSRLSQHLHRFLFQPHQTIIDDIIKSEEIGLIIAFIFTVYKNRRDIIDHNFKDFLTNTGKSLLTTSTNIASIVTAKHVIDIGLQSCNLHLNPTIESAIAWMIIDTGKEAISVIRDGKSIKEASGKLKYDAIDLTIGYAVASLVTSLTGGQVYIGWAAGAITKMALNSQRDIIIQFCEGNFNIGEIISNRKRPIRIYTPEELVSMGYKAIRFLEFNLKECKYKEIEFKPIQYKTIKYQSINYGECMNLLIVSHVNDDDMKTAHFIQNELTKKKIDAGIMNAVEYLKNTKLPGTQPLISIGGPHGNKLSKQLDFLPIVYSHTEKGEYLSLPQSTLAAIGLISISGIFVPIIGPIISVAIANDMNKWQKYLYIKGDWREGGRHVVIYGKDAKDTLNATKIFVEKFLEDYLLHISK